MYIYRYKFVAWFDTKNALKLYSRKEGNNFFCCWGFKLSKLLNTKKEKIRKR